MHKIGCTVFYKECCIGGLESSFDSHYVPMFCGPSLYCYIFGFNIFLLLCPLVHLIQFKNTLSEFNVWFLKLHNYKNQLPFISPIMNAH